ncbi:hypothetical protein V1286_002131 [Bradyrhizobium algeriense]|uniref:Uncharacterized protein n=1 Tax=Bradyrhizobium algeriense TaxID=634784 RepID=A0ABU8B8Y0_9BRAD
MKFDEDKPLAKQEAMMRRVSDLGSPDHRGDRGAAAARQDGLGDVILSIAFGGNAGCGVRSVI